jgi:hypothetical protein
MDVISVLYNVSCKKKLAMSALKTCEKSDV